MKYPHLKPNKLMKNTVSVFGGLDKTDSCAENFFSHTKNTSSHRFPLLSVREKRIKLTDLQGSPSALYTVNGITYTLGTKLYYNNVLQFDMLSDTDEKQIVSMGSKVIIFPDGYYFNTLVLNKEGISEDQGYLLPPSVFFGPDLTVTPCIPDLPVPPAYNAAPEDPKDGDYWLDISAIPNILYKYNGASSQWETAELTHTAINILGIDQGIKVGYPLEIQGISDELDGMTTVDAVADNIIVIPKKTEYLTGFIFEKYHKVTISQPFPIMDFVCEHQNRLFGCRYGKNLFGEFVNEIYASKPGCPELWFEYKGLSTDSYAASCGSEGEWTGIASHLGYVLFFKENRIHRLFGTKPANYTLYEDAYSGVKKGSEKSLVLMNGTLYYHGAEGIYAYTGSSPALVSEKLGREPFFSAVAAGTDGVYCVCMSNVNNERNLFSYDTIKDIWHREDNSDFMHLAPLNGNILGVLKGASSDSLFLLRSSKIPNLCQKLYSSSIVTENSFEWFAESGPIGLRTENRKYLNKLQLRLETDNNSSITVYFSVNSKNNWEKCAELSSPTTYSHTVNIRPPRCDHLYLKLCGHGECRLSSITKYLEEASGVN